MLWSKCLYFALIPRISGEACASHGCVSRGGDLLPSPGQQSLLLESIADRVPGSGEHGHDREEEMDILSTLRTFGPPLPGMPKLTRVGMGGRVERLSSYSGEKDPWRRPGPGDVLPGLPGRSQPKRKVETRVDQPPFACRPATRTRKREGVRKSASPARSAWRGDPVSGMEILPSREGGLADSCSL
jgi:hypothetical protein